MANLFAAHRLDALLSPTMPVTTVPIPDLFAERPDYPGESPILSMIHHTFSANLTGQPALSAPCGLARNGLPIGFQLLGRPFDEATLSRWPTPMNGSRPGRRCHPRFMPDETGRSPNADPMQAGEPSVERRYQLGIDIGGTFTDLSLLDRETGQHISLKTPTVPADPTRGVANGIALLAQQGIHPSEIGYFVHGTTIGVNAVIQRSGARIALLVTDGFRDVLEMARLRLPTPWDFYGQRPAPLLPRELVVPVRERVRYGGMVETSLTDDEIERVISTLTALAVEGVAICLLHSYANPAHELALKRR